MANPTPAQLYGLIELGEHPSTRRRAASYCLEVKGNLTFKPRKGRQRLVHTLSRRLPRYADNAQNVGPSRSYLFVNYNERRYMITDITTDITTIGVIGAGLVGSGWVIVFARAGHRVRVYDPSPEVRAQLPDKLVTTLTALNAHRLISDVEDVLGRVEVVGTLSESLEGVTYVQESVPERVDIKRAIYQDIAARILPEVAVGSSSSGIPGSVFMEGLRHAANYLIAHPVNPPYLVPVVELVPTPWTSEVTLGRVYELMEAVGQVPVRVNRELKGFILNRLQGALLREAWALFDEGYATAADIDKTISYGLGLRWSFMGPFETIDLNAPNGIRDYAERLGELYLDIALERAHPEAWSAELVSRVERERRQALPLEGLAQRSDWRDNRLMALAIHRAQMSGVAANESDEPD